MSSFYTIAGGETYTIPFDSIDARYLGEYVDRPIIETKPLWTRNRLNGEGEYCQVKLIVAQNDEETYCEPSETYMCHICNVYVPKIYSKEHNESEQHETIKRIYQTVLEKVSKHMDTSTENINQKINKNEYYCVPCSKIIKKENRDKHESTEYHAKSRKDTIIINEFYKIIIEDKGNETILITEKVTDVREKVTDVTEVRDIEKNKCLKTNYNEDTTNKKLSNHLETNQSSTDNLAIPGPSNINSKIQPLKEDNTNPFEAYLKEMKKKYNIKANLPSMIGESVKIESETGVILVSQEHFHSYKLLKSCIYCQLCKMWISQDTKPHEVTENHVRNILKPINEKFARTIDIVSSHCVACNDVVLSDSEAYHVLSDIHKKVIKDTRVQKTGQTFCEDCSLFIDSHNYAVHLNSKKHWNVIMKQNSLTTTETANVFFCKICNINVPKIYIKTHVVVNTHLVKKAKIANDLDNKHNGATDMSVKNTAPAKINDKNTAPAKIKDKNTAPPKINDKNTHSPENGLKKNDSEYCDICKVMLPIGGTKIHEKGKAHKAQINKLIDNNIKAQENKVQTANSNTSTTSSNTNKNSVAKSNCSSNSTVISDKKLDEYYNQLEFANDLNAEVRCKICFVYMPFIERMIIDHMESESHIELANEYKIDKYNKFLLYTDDDKTKVLCELCYVYIPNNHKNIIEHMEGRNHELAETGLLEFHSMRKVIDSYICDCCEIQTLDYIEHTKSAKHNLSIVINQA